MSSPILQFTPIARDLVEKVVIGLAYSREFLVISAIISPREQFLFAVIRLQDRCFVAKGVLFTSELLVCENSDRRRMRIQVDVLSNEGLC